MNDTNRKRWRPTVLAMMCFLSGCATTPPAHLYRLAALSEAVEAHAGEAIRTIRLQSVVLPGVLQQPTVITQSSPILIRSSEFHRWAEPLEEQIAEVLTRNLAALLPGHHVVRGRMHPGLKANVELHVEVFQFDGILGEQAQLDLRWSQTREGESTELHRWQGQRALEGNDVQAYVLAQSGLLAEASLTLAEHIE